jgi:GTP pyrophosphokinase
MEIEELVQKDQKALVGRAYYFGQTAHKGQTRLSGDPFFDHPVAVAQILLDWRMDETTVAAGLLHDVVEDTACTLEQIKREFGEEIAFLIDGVTKLTKLKYQETERTRKNAEKFIMAIGRDLRILLIKLADRLHNIRTIGSLPPEKGRAMALETYEIYASLAYRLGMQRLSGELEDLAFIYLYPKEYEELASRVKEYYSEREEYLERIKPDIIKALSEAGINPLFIEFRAKRYSSLYKKLLRYDMDIEKIYDLVAFRIIVGSVADCYSALGVIHKLYPPLPGRIKDYIAMPKPNNYRSLHTTVFGPDKKIIEFQIRTPEMHEEAENGIAAAWAYEQGKHRKSYRRREAVFAQTAEIEWLKKLRAWQKKASGGDDFIEALKTDFFKDRIFALTPTGDVIDLPVGATPIDFAYHIHSWLGDHCVGARINNRLVPLDRQLQSSDIVEILTQKNKKPSASWLDFVKTNHAKHYIKKALNIRLPRQRQPETKR